MRSVNEVQRTVKMKPQQDGSMQDGCCVDRGEVSPISFQICFSCADGFAALSGARSTSGGFTRIFFFFMRFSCLCFLNNKKVGVVCRIVLWRILAKLLEDSVRVVKEFLFFILFWSKFAWVSRVLRDLTVLGESNRSSIQSRCESELKTIG